MSCYLNNSEIITPFVFMANLIKGRECGAKAFKYYNKKKEFSVRQLVEPNLNKS